jgi:hypothetical protein
VRQTAAIAFSDEECVRRIEVEGKESTVFTSTLLIIPFFTLSLLHIN